MGTQCCPQSCRAEIQSALKETPPGFPRACQGKAAPLRALWAILSPSHGYGENYRSERTGIPVPPYHGVPPRVSRCSIQMRVFFLKRKEQGR